MQGVASYSLDHLVADVKALVPALGHNRCDVLAGHDWGGMVAWMVAAMEPELVGQLVVVAAPHPALFLRNADLMQLLGRSWYMLVFQVRASCPVCMLLL